MIRRLCPLLPVLALASCSELALTTPESLPVREYSAGNVNVSVVVSSCSDTCAKYEASECTVLREVGTSKFLLTIRVPYSYPERDAASEPACSAACGPAVLAHCFLGYVPAGAYELVSGTFRDTILVK